MKLCKDCKWSKPMKFFIFDDWEMAECHAPFTASPVTGNTGRLCLHLRRTFTPCGENARFWEPRNG
jgi:hypothetical protein